MELVSLEDWIKENRLDVDFIDYDLFYLDKILYKVIYPKTVEIDGTERELLVDRNFEFYYTSEEIEFIRDNNIQKVVFQFGSHYYYCDPFEPKFDLFKHIGKCSDELTFDFPFLGIHGGYELGNGSKDYPEWCKKAKFLGYKTLAICEENTLGGTLSFQGTCEENDIKPIIGETVTVLENETRYSIKLYVINDRGWDNLLKISNYINCNGDTIIDKVIPFEELKKYVRGLVCVLTPETVLTDVLLKKYSAFEHLYYQLDFTEWSSNDRDTKWLENIKDYFENYKSKIRPILIQDAYYLDASDHEVKKILNKIVGVGFKPQSSDQWFKSGEEIYTQMSSLFKSEDDRQYEIFYEALDNAKSVGELCTFKIRTGNLFLPKYIMTEEEEAKYATTEDLFYDLIEKGFEKYIIGKVPDESIYYERLETELETINKGGFQDYFLILADVLRHCREQGALIGLGRGSAAGALLSYVTNLTGVDPVKYGLLFERFLNDGRFKDVKYQHYFLTMEDDTVKEFDEDSMVEVKREGKFVDILAKDLAEGDELILN
jgi:DNA polymerase-3 subunit alpha